MNKFLIIFAFVPLFCFGQKQGNIWYFGNHAGLDFNSGNPTPLTNGQTYTDPSNSCPVEGTAVICDNTGALLFYTDGQKIWNKNQQVMPHGDSLLGNFSSTQAALIVPQPGSSRYFYVFTTDDFCVDHLQYGFRYSVVDICLDNGLGAVIPNRKNIKLIDTVAEKLTAVRHANGVDYWVITHKYFSDAFYSYHLSSAGIVDTVISHIGSRHPTGVGVGASIGEFKASPNGQKLAIVNGQDVTDITEYFDFDKSTGIVSNCVSIQTNPLYSYYGVSFSPDNSKLYISCWLNNNGIYQFDLNAGSGNPDSVKASKKTIITNSGSWAMQLAPNGKIYVAQNINSGQYISCINNPNNSGLNCNFVASAIYLNGDTSYNGLPNFIDSYDYSNTTFNCINGIEKNNYNNRITISPNPFSTQTIIYTDNYFKDATLTVFNSFGQQVKQIKNINRQTIILHRDNLPCGLYFIRLTQDNKTFVTEKLVITDN